MAMVFEMVHPDDREYAARIVEETIRSGTHLKAEHRIVRPDGEVRFVQVLGTVKRDASGCAYEMFGTVRTSLIVSSQNKPCGEASST